MSLKQVHLFVRGRVQGVFFRASTQREARRLGLTGWVKNRPDGAVEVLAEGDEDEIKELIGWAHKGPGAARVERSTSLAQLHRRLSGLSHHGLAGNRPFFWEGRLRSAHMAERSRDPRPARPISQPDIFAVAASGISPAPSVPNLCRLAESCLLSSVTLSAEPSRALARPAPTRCRLRTPPRPRSSNSGWLA